MDYALVEQHRSDIAALTTLYVDDLVKLWATYDGVTDARVVETGLRSDMAELWGDHGSSASLLGTDLYEAMREDAGAPGRYRPRMFDPLSRDTINRNVGWSVKPLYSGAQDRDGVLSRLSGSGQRVIANYDRETIAGNVRRDRTAVKYVRQASATCCAFCAVMATRNDLGSHYHRNCRCVIVPSWDGSDVPQHYDTFRAEYDAAVAQAREAGDPLRIPSKQRRQAVDTILWRIRENTGRR